MQYKLKLLQLGAGSGEGSVDGQAALDFHYHLEGDMVHVGDAGEQGRYVVWVCGWLGLGIEGGGGCVCIWGLSHTYLIDDIDVSIHT